MTVSPSMTKTSMFLLSEQSAQPMMKDHLIHYSALTNSMAQGPGAELVFIGKTYLL